MPSRLKFPREARNWQLGIMRIGGLQTLTLIDYPGKIACTVFSIGCNYRCPFCYNPQLVLPKHTAKQPRIPEKWFFNFLKQRKNLIEGVVIGGGEPASQKELPKFCQRIKKMGFSIKIDTNGSYPKALEELIDEKLIDYVALDVKAPKEKYAELVGFHGCSPYYLASKVEQSINLLKKGKIDYELRTTVVPELLKKEDILKIAKWLAPAKRYFLQNFQAKETLNPKLKTLKPYSQEELLEIQKAIAPLFETCQIR